MQLKYNRSLSGLPESNSNRYHYENEQFRYLLPMRNDMKYQSICTSLQSQRFFDQKKIIAQKEVNLSLNNPIQTLKSYKEDAEIYSYQNIKKFINQERVKKSLNYQESDKENYTQTYKPKIFKEEFRQNLRQIPSIKYNYSQQENQKLTQQYSDEIFEFFQEKDRPSQQFLKVHDIPSNLRSKMVDWMIEVFASYKCSEQTFFLSVKIMDEYFKKALKRHGVNDLHLIGVTSIFIAAKFEELYPIKLTVIYEKIGHRKIPKEEIRLMESEILERIGYDLVGGTIFDIVNLQLQKFQLEQKIEPKNYKYMMKLCLYLAKMILFDYDLISQYNYFLLSGGLIFVGFKILEQLESTFKSEEQILEIIELAQLDHDELIEVASKVLNLAKMFETLHPTFENLKKFNAFALEE